MSKVIDDRTILKERAHREFFASLHNRQLQVSDAQIKEEDAPASFDDKTDKELDELAVKRLGEKRRGGQ